MSERDWNYAVIFKSYVMTQVPTVAALEAAFAGPATEKSFSVAQLFSGPSCQTCGHLGIFWRKCEA